MKKIYHSLLVIGRGTGQVMFQNNALSGLLMLVGIFANSWQMGLLAICGNIISTLTAFLLRYDQEDINDGLYGFNSTLVGIATGVFLHLSPTSFLLTAVASAASTFITRLFKMQNFLSGFTAPFIIAVWILLGFCSWLMPETLLPSTDAATHTDETLNLLYASSLGIGQVMFQGSVLSGALFLAGILVNSRTAAFYTILGTLLSIPTAMMMGIDHESVNLGLMGYNGVLCAIALGGNNWSSLAWASASVILSVVLQIAGMHYGITTLTAPFVLSVWIIASIRKFTN